MPASSAAGEQPKFSATIVESAATGQGIECKQYRSVMVKFSGELASPIAVRWGDLLISEYLAIEVLSENGFSTPRAELIFAGNRVFLEYDRIDRPVRIETRESNTMPRIGRFMTSSLSSIDSAFIGSPGGTWISAMTAAPEYFRKEDISTVERLYYFGMAIGNNDMHYGNLSFYIDKELPFRLAPIYDMLPMYYAPAGDGSLRNTPMDTLPPTSDSLAMSKEFWQRVANHPNVSQEFKDLSLKNARR